MEGVSRTRQEASLVFLELLFWWPPGLRGALCAFPALLLGSPAVSLTFLLVEGPRGAFEFGFEETGFVQVN